MVDQVQHQQRRFWPARSGHPKLLADHTSAELDPNSTSAWKALTEMGSESELTVVDEGLKLMSLDNSRLGDVGPVELDDAAPYE